MTVTIAQAVAFVLAVMALMTISFATGYKCGRDIGWNLVSYYRNKWKDGAETDAFALMLATLRQTYAYINTPRDWSAVSAARFSQLIEDAIKAAEGEIET